MVKKSAMKKKHKKPWKINSLIIKSLIILAVLMMLLSSVLSDSMRVNDSVSRG